jgi:hypothetical protein
MIFQLNHQQLLSGGVCDGAPGLRDVHPNFCAAYILDPTGTKLVVVCHSD